MGISARHRNKRGGGGGADMPHVPANPTRGEGLNDVSFQEVRGQRRTSEDNGIVWGLNASDLGIIGACAAVLTLMCVGAVMWFRSRRHRSLMDKLLGGEGQGVRSAPASRVGSPKISKRKSCPNINSPYHAQSPKGLVSCSIASDRIPDFTLPERVQPSTPRDAHGRVFSFSASQRHSSVGAIKPELYTAPGSSEEESDALPKSAHGRLWFSLLYDAVVGQLSVTLVKVKDLPGRASSSQQARDPFVKMFLLPDEKSTRMSKVKKKTLSPIYDETHTFEVAQEDIAGRVLRFSVYDVDKRRVRHSLGHVMIPLRGVDLTRGDVTMSELEPMVQAAASLGDLQVSLAYYPQNDKIKVGFHRARNLQGMDEEAEATTYIRAQLYYGHKNVRTKRTTTRPTSSDHHINESVSFTVAGKQLSQCSIVVALVTTSPYSKGQCDEDYGRTVIGPFMYARGEELVHWQDMVAHPRVVATRWHSLTGKHEGPAKGALHFSH